MKENIIIKEMTEEYLDQVCAIEEKTFSMPWHKESFLEMINHPKALYLIAIDTDGRVLAMAGILDVAGEGNICNIAVDEEYRHHGIGSKLFGELLKRGYEQFGLSACTLEVRLSNTSAIGLYEKFGFISEGIRPNFYDKPTEDAMIMWKR